MLRTRLASCLILVLTAATVASAGDLYSTGYFVDCPTVVRVHYSTRAQVDQIAWWTEPWEVNREQGYMVLGVDDEGYRRLLDGGFEVEVDEKLTRFMCTPHEMLEGQKAGIPGYPCYRTVEETFVTASDIVATYPQLATLHDVGDSWDKTEVGGAAGYDLMVLKLTNSQVPGTPTGTTAPHGKPRLFVTSAIHAREYTTAELMTRFAEYLVSHHGVDADATWLLDEHEIHLMLHANPDGRKQAETGLSWRKNTNQNYCGATSNDRGADLNRNFEFQWGCCGGSSGYECDTTYRGPSPFSEPESQTVRDYARMIFPDQRDDALGSAAPDDATGIYLDVHSSGELVIWPWGFTSDVPGNGVAHETLGRKLAYFNNHWPGQAIGLYPTDGTTDDFTYGDLGVASYCFELGTSFFQSCSYFESTILPGNMQALLYLAKVARTPYLTPAGPDVASITLVPGSIVAAGAPLLVKAVVDDTRFNSTNGSEPTQNVSAARYLIDRTPWSQAGVGPTGPLFANDRVYDSPVETAVVTIKTRGLANGRHTLYLQAQDDTGQWGAVSSTFFWVLDPATAPRIEGVVTSDLGGGPLAATVTAGTFSTTSSAADGFYSMMVTEGTYDVTASAIDHLPSTVTGVSATTGNVEIVDFLLTYQETPPVLLVDDDDNDPDVRTYYTDALDTMGIPYDVWDTGNSDMEPSAAELAPYEAVIWFSGDEWINGVAGPGSAGEAALATYLDTGRCFLISGQDYYYNRGLTPFMQTYLGTASAESDVSQDVVSGAGPIFSGLGPYNLSYPFSNYSDVVSPNSGGDLAFSGDAGDAAVSRDGGVYKTAFLGFPLEAVPSEAERIEILEAFLEGCLPLK